MSSFLISYDQHRDKDYTPIWTALRNAGAVRLLESVWLLEANLTASAVVNWLRQITRDEDSLAAVELKPFTPQEVEDSQPKPGQKPGFNGSDIVSMLRECQPYGCATRVASSM